MNLRHADLPDHPGPPLGGRVHVSPREVHEGPLRLEVVHLDEGPEDDLLDPGDDVGGRVVVEIGHDGVVGYAQRLASQRVAADGFFPLI